MKLSTKTSLNFLSVALFTFLFGIIAFYYTLRYQVDKYINLELNKSKIALLEQTAKLNKFPSTTYGNCQLMTYKTIEFSKENTNFYKDTLILDKKVNRYKPYRLMTFSTTINNQAYEIQMLRTLEETDGLIINIFLFMTLLFILLIVILLIVNQYSSNQIWKDFYLSLDKINKFDLNIHKDIKLTTTDIKEFEDLNIVLRRMTKRIASDYSKMKEYTENASHEIQTPLAIINSKLELLLQCKELPEKQYQIIADASEASDRLARLNKTLILLTRIENRQFPEEKTIFPQQIIEKHLNNYEEIILSKGIKLSTTFEPEVNIQINPHLADILFLNLIKNAIRHNIPNGELKIKLNSTIFEIANSGAPLDIDSELLFDRFFKSTKSSQSLGLGLSIVKKITELFNIKINYIYTENLHVVKLIFPK
ncbi:MAG: HAMP domain-containing histidine kinase [Bacteroidales bacterium]|nr:HAMP domain-containing histidine kinase [Bacteroidales bacterium]